MPRKVIQKAIYQVIQPAVYQYTCDSCGKVCGTKDNPKQTLYGRGSKSYYCKRTCSPFGCRGQSWSPRHRRNCYYCQQEDKA
jgi:hypothetical protein